MPPFLLLDAMEAGGLQNVQPEELPANCLLDMLAERADPAFLRPEMADEILKASRDLPEELGTLDSWFEEGAEVDQLLRAKNLTRSKRIELGAI
jgi:hypothetical protein